MPNRSRWLLGAALMGTSLAATSAQAKPDEPTTALMPAMVTPMSEVDGFAYVMFKLKPAGLPSKGVTACVELPEGWSIEAAYGGSGPTRSAEATRPAIEPDPTKAALVSARHPGNWTCYLPRADKITLVQGERVTLRVRVGGGPGTIPIRTLSTDGKGKKGAVGEHEVEVLASSGPWAVPADRAQIAASVRQPEDLHAGMSQWLKAHRTLIAEGDAAGWPLDAQAEDEAGIHPVWNALYDMDKAEVDFDTRAIVQRDPTLLTLRSRYFLTADHLRQLHAPEPLVAKARALLDQAAAWEEMSKEDLPERQRAAKEWLAEAESVFRFEVLLPQELHDQMYVADMTLSPFVDAVHAEASAVYCSTHCASYEAKSLQYWVRGQTLKHSGLEWEAYVMCDKAESTLTQAGEARDGMCAEMLPNSMPTDDAEVDVDGTNVLRLDPLTRKAQHSASLVTSDEFVVYALAGTTLRATVATADFPAKIILMPKDGEPVLFDGTTATSEVLADGTYTLVITTTTPGSTGDYTLDVSLEGGDPVPADAVSIQWSGEWTETGDVREHHTDTMGHIGTEWDLTVYATSFDPVLTVATPDGKVYNSVNGRVQASVGDTEGPMVVTVTGTQGTGSYFIDGTATKPAE